MVTKRTANMCKNFKEYDEFEVRRDPNLVFGDGTCLGSNHIIHNDYNCPTSCDYWGEYKIK
ncbi:MAG: hypothetical protein ABIJ14_01445 [Nanoarchaeota archaeon]